MASTIFDKIVAGEMQVWKIWEDDDYLAFLTPFANTPGATVVIPKVNAGDYIFSIDDKDYAGLMAAIKMVAHMLERAFDTPRIALIFEGTGVAYVHAKLYPLHGALAHQTNVWSSHTEFYPEYLGYLTTVEGPRMNDQELDKIQSKVIAAQHQ
jgi:beta-aspartyl-peptidase (threonine type)